MTNDGDEPLSGVFVEDLLTPGCDRAIGDLAVGETITYTCATVGGVVVDFINTITATGTPPEGVSDVTDTSSAEVDVINPSISITKDPSSQDVAEGADATFTITVTNTGDVPLTSVDVSDPLVPDCDSFIGDLAVGVSSTPYSCVATAPVDDFSNVATATGTPPVGPDVSDSSTALVNVIIPSIAVTKGPDQDVVEGLDAAFTITVTNDLAVGVSTTYTCILVGVLASFENIATATATVAGGETVTGIGTATITVLPGCNGLAATIVGTNGPDVIFGTLGNDVIVSFDGNDDIDGMGGDDTVCAGRGDDNLRTRGGLDWISGGEGDDVIRADGGANIVHGDQGHDEIYTGPGPDTINGNDGNDTIRSGRGDDIVRGDAGDDRLITGRGRDTVNGGVGNDQIRSGDDDDTVFGDAGNDIIGCGAGIDSADGGLDIDLASTDCETQVNIP